MRIIMMVMSAWLSACTTLPMFPPETMKDVEANTFDSTVWERQAYQPSGAKFIPHKVELAGQIIKVIQKPNGIIILAEEHPIDERPLSGSMNSGQDDAPWFAITFKGTVEPRMLQTGNRLMAVGTTSQARTEMLGGAPRMLPHLKAQCLHIWNTEEVKNQYVYSDSGVVGKYPPEQRTFCLEENIVGSSASGSPNDVNSASGGRRTEEGS